MSPSNTDPNFEQFRRQRKRAQVRYSGPPRTDAVVREIQEYESKQIHEARLTREVHEFLEDATRQAASIVEKVTVAAEHEVAERLQTEMQTFLAETVRRATTFLMQIQTKRGRASLTEMEAQVSNIVGPALDAFRFEGTAQLKDKHIGQDPFYEPEATPTVSPNPVVADEASDETAGGDEDANPATPATPAPRVGAKRHPLLDRLCEDPDALKTTLKALVGAGVIDAESARQIYAEVAGKS